MWWLTSFIGFSWLSEGTRAQQVLVGLAILVVGFFTSKALGLTTLTWIFDNFIGSFLLIIVVVFQNDIRRLLSRVGKGPLSGPGRSQRGAHLVEQLALAAETMSRQRIGALVLVERDADLSELATQGAAIEVDAELSANLLVQVFTPPGPASRWGGDHSGRQSWVLPRRFCRFRKIPRSIHGLAPVTVLHLARPKNTMQSRWW